MKTRALVVLALAASPSMVVPQEMPPHAGGGIAAIQPLYARVKDLLVRSAELMPEEQYSFRPTPDVRTYGQLLGHVSNENYLFCAGALGEPNPNTADFEKTTSKTELVKALKDSFAYCDPAYRMAR